MEEKKQNCDCNIRERRGRGKGSKKGGKTRKLSEKAIDHDFLFAFVVELYLFAHSITR